jgi:protein-L-isoaspartate(D-aspartate) O-methyltransferase
MVERLQAQGVTDPLVLDAINAVPRHRFIEEALASRAYDDVSLPIGFGQTISRPLTVARSCEIARSGKQLTRVLEIGTGCGYQAAVLSKISDQVYSIERISSLVTKARVVLRSLNLRNIQLKHADGSFGLDSLKPLDAIVIAAGATEIPEQFIDLLATGGRMVVPVGDETQYLTEVLKLEEGYRTIPHESVTFVPFLNGVVVK